MMKQKKTLEDYLKTIYVLQKENGVVRGTDIASALGVSRPTVCVTLRELEEEGYVRLDDRRRVYLTAQGESIAGETHERNRTFFTLLTALGVDERTAAADACRLEHSVCEESFKAFKKLAVKLGGSGEKEL